MHAFEFLRAPSGPGIKPAYAVFGDDAYLRRETLGGIVSAALGGGDADDELAVARFAGEQAILADVLDEVRTLPFLVKRRVAVVEEADSFVTKYRKGLEEYTETPVDTGTLVLVVKTWPSNTKLAKRFEKIGLAIDCKAPAERELPGWLTALAKSKGLNLDRDTAALMVELVGAEVGLLAAELDKLATCVGRRASIRRDDVAKMVGAGRVETIWKILDAATTGAAGRALGDLDRLLISGEHPVGLLAALTSSLRKVHHAGELRRARRDLKDACREAGIPSYPGAVDKVQKQHAHLGPRRVAHLPALLLQADLDLKGSSTLPPRVVLERLIIQLARPRGD